MAKFINANKHRGYLNNVNIESRNKNSMVITDFIKGFENPMGRGESLNLNFKLNKAVQQEVNNSQPDDQIDPIGNEKRFWMKLMRPKKQGMSVTARLKSVSKKIETSISVLILLLITLSQFEYELIYYDNFYLNKTPDKYNGQALRVIYSVISFFLIVLSFYARYYSFLIKIEEKIIVQQSFYKSFFFKKFLFEALIMSVHPFPGVDAEMELVILNQPIVYRLQTILYSFQLIKIYQFTRLIAINSSYINNINDSNIQNHDGDSDIIFCLKCIQKDQPFRMLTISLLMTVLVLGIELRMFEILNIEGDGNEDFYFYTNGMWTIVVAITTVGYGDFYPKTHVGRLIVVIAIFLGTFLMSLTIVALQKVTSFDKDELGAFTVLKRMQVRKELNDVLVRILQTNVRIFLYQLRMIRNKTKPGTSYTRLLRLRIELTSLKMNLSREISIDNFTSEEDKFLELEPRIDTDVNSIKNNLKQMELLSERFACQLEEQQVFMKNLDTHKKVIEQSLKQYFYKLFVNKVNNTFTNESIETSNVMGTSHDIFKNNLNLLKNFSMKEKVIQLRDSRPNKELENVESGSNSQEEDTFREQNQYYVFKDKKSREVTKSKSTKTFEMVRSLQQLREKNISVQKAKRERKRSSNESSFENSATQFSNPVDNIVTSLVKKTKQEKSSGKKDITPVMLNKHQDKSKEGKGILDESADSSAKFFKKNNLR